VHLFDAKDGKFLKTIPNPHPASGDLFGFAVAAAGSRLVVGAPGVDLPGAEDGGGAYVFERDPVTHEFGASPKRTLGKSAPKASDQFGAFVAGDGTLVVVGAPFDNDAAPEAGAAYVFDLGSNAGPRVLRAPRPERLDLFGASVAIRGDTVV